MTFKEWLAKQGKREDRVGKISRVAAADSCWSGYTAASLRRHIDAVHRPGAAVEAVRLARDEWWLAESVR